jgi:hypothetical protein
MTWFEIVAMCSRVAEDEDSSLEMLRKALQIIQIVERVNPPDLDAIAFEMPTD